MPNCKVGDRAIITAPQNYGKQCVILAEHNILEWFVETLEPAIAYEHKTYYKVPAGYQGCLDKHYAIPLADPDQHITNDVKELENA